MESIRKIKVDESKIHMAVDSRVPLTILTYTLPHEMEDFMGEVLKAFIAEVGAPNSADALVYCLKELTNNAKKANTKRVYFEEKNLTITNPADYEAGMKDFKVETVSNITHYLQKQKEQGLFVKLTLRALENDLLIEVRNNVELTVFEYKRIHDKITRSLVYRSVEEGIMELLDDTEGAGLGLAIMMLILRRAGLSEENYKIISEGGETVAQLVLPYTAFDRSDFFSVKDAAIALIDDLPVRKKTLSEISRILSNPFGRLGDIASVVSSDVAFMANVLKRVNGEPEFMAYPCDSISGAIKSSGRRRMWQLLFDLSSHESCVMQETDDDALWVHSHRVALYAYNLALNLMNVSVKDRFLEQLYVAALLHDIAKIAFGRMPSLASARFEELCERNKLRSDRAIEKFTGFYHAEMGAALAEKWNFSVPVVNAIKYHHDPLNAPQEYRKIASLVSCADLLVHYRSGDIFYEQMDGELLRFVGITSESMAASLCAIMEDTRGGGI